MVKEEGQIERIVVKMPRNLANYFRKTFPHGRRSDFIVRCILDYKKKKEIEAMEDKLREAGKKRQKF